MQKKRHHKFNAPYGNWLHFDERESVNQKHNVYGTPRVRPDNDRFKKMKNKMTYEPFFMNTLQRKNVLDTIISVCDYCHWRLFAVNIRTNHLHLVVQSEESAEHVMTKIKAYASRNLNILNPENKERTYWTRHGSTIHVATKDYFYFLVDYVVNRQGANVACYYEKWFDDFLMTGIVPDNMPVCKTVECKLN